VKPLFPDFLEKAETMRFALPIVASCASAVMVSTLGLTVPAAAAGSATVTPTIDEHALTEVSEDGLDAPGARESSPVTTQVTNSSTTNLPNLLRSPSAVNALGMAPLGTFGSGSTAISPVSLQESQPRTPSGSAPEETSPEPTETPDMSGGVREKTEDGVNIAAISDVLEVPESRSSVVGVTYDTETEVTVEVRIRTGEGWSAWDELEEDVVGEGTPGTEPFVVSGASEVQMRVLGDAAPEDARLLVIDPKHSAADQQAVEQNAPVAAPAPGAEAPGEAAVEGAAAGAEGYAAQPAAAVPATAAPGSATAQTVAVKKVSKPKIGSRKSWGANERLRKGKASYAPKVRAAVVHHTAGSNSYSAGDVPGILRGIYSFHTKGRGWSDVGYNVLVDKYGRLWEGRAGGVDRAVIGAHVAGYNTGTFGISVMGSYERSAPPEAAINAVNHAIAWKLSASGVSVEDRATVGGRSIPAVVGHRDLGSTSCPGAAFYSKLGSMRKDIEKLQQGGAPAAPEKETPKPAPKKTAIDTHYEGKEKVLGKPTSKEWDLAGGKVKNFERGYITWSKATGPQVISGAIATAWNGATRTKLGLPVTGEQGGLKGGGAYQKFQGGSMHWSSKSGAQPTWGILQGYWASKGYENGHIGYPKSAPQCSDGRCEQLYEGARLVWAEGYGVTEFSPRGDISAGARDLNASQPGSADGESAEPGSGPAGPGEGSADQETEQSPAPTQTPAPAPSEEPRQETPRAEEPKQDESEKDEPEKDESKKGEPEKDESKKDEPKEEKPKKSAEQIENEKRDAVIATAKKHLGVKYRWGGTSPRSGWDCSGYVQYVYAQNGIKLPRSSGAQKAAGEVIPASQAKPGDLIWIPGHLGIVSETEGQMYDAGSTRTNTSKRSYDWMLKRGAVFVRVI